MYKKTDFIWMDGSMIPWDSARVHVLTHTLHYGVGVFEGIRYYKNTESLPTIFRLKDHLIRFFDSCKILSMALPFSLEQLLEATRLIVKKNGLLEGYIRPIAFIGDEPNAGLWAYDNDTHVAIMTWGWGAYLGDEGIKKGIRAKFSSLARHHRNISMVTAKVNGQYVNSVLAKREAKISGFDEAILLDPEGFIAEGSGQNLFMVRDGVVYTPEPGAILLGITRDTVLEMLRKSQHRIEECKITRDQLLVADEIFLTGTAAEITPIREIDGIKIGPGTPGPITQSLQKAYQDLVRGRKEANPEWFEVVA